MNPVGWFEIYIDDIARAKSFYESLFQLSLEALGDPSDDSVTMLAFPSDYDNYGSSGAIVHMNGVSAGNNSTLVYFSCEDCAAQEARVVAAGGTVQRSKMSIGEYGHISLVLDTEGNLIGLHSQQ
jgi:predicted enzyme related to lactoylglutathione lyase